MHPLVLLENHSSVGAKQFIAENAVYLKRLGYRKVLIEMNSELSSAALKSQLKSILSIPGQAKYHKMVHHMLNMFNALEQNGVEYEFIDPETQEEGHRLNMDYKNASTPAERYRLAQLRNQKTAQRDLIMSAYINDQVIRFEGGVIVFVGFAHRKLVELLKGNVRYALFHNSIEDSKEAISDPEWDSLSNQMYREQYYSAQTYLFDLALKPSFEMMSATMQLSDSSPCQELSQLGRFFNQAIDANCYFEINSDKVVSAVLNLEHAQLTRTTNKIQTTFPGLNFFFTADQKTLRVPGINLPENNQILSTGFRKLQIMS